LARYVRLMHQGDITQAAEIDREAFPTQWPPSNYRHELKNPLAHYIVAYDDEKILDETKVEVASEKSHPRLVSKVRQLFNRNRSFSNETLPSTKEYIVGLTGFWIMAGEAHVTTIAVRLSYHRRGIGEQLFISLIELAKELNARTLTLEVRVSNVAAQGLYSKYGLTQVGLRRGYYSDNREDAMLMSTEDITSASFQAHFQQLKQAHSKRWETAHYQVAR
jgi:ribosomal-protein-alanine N-acetyltransferase